MFDVITEKKKQYIKTKDSYIISTVFVFEKLITLLARGLMFEICWACNQNYYNNNNSNSKLYKFANNYSCPEYLLLQQHK